MDRKKWKKISRIFDLALTLPHDRRSTYIRHLCADNPELQQEIDQLLESLEESDQMLEEHLEKNEALLDEFATHLEKTSSQVQTDLTGRTIGRWTLTELLGHGGMGSVYKAKKTDSEIHQTGALKIMHQNLNTPENAERFKLEQQILAGLHHPNIASRVDGGISDDGLPYLVMEYVEGKPILEYCDQRKFTVEDRLQLFIDVCEAVQFAHKNLIVHRDLKPDNILVTEEGHVKILDFGIAKLLDPDMYDFSAIDTRQGLSLMSLESAAPEQVSGGTITTSTDLYALGILFYKLLSGVHPYDFEDKRYQSIMQMIREEHPSSPSHRIANIDSNYLSEIAESRETKTSDLISRLKGDLDAIVLKALRKEPDARYDSAGVLIDDITAYLQDKPVLARGEALQYRIKKFFKRHMKGIAAAAMFVLVVVSLVSYYTFRLAEERNIANLEADKAQQVTDFLVNLFEANDPNLSKGDEITARALLNRGAESINSMDEQPDLQAEMLALMGRIYTKLGNYSKAKSYFQQALKLRSRNFGPQHPKTAAVMSSLGLLHLEMEEIDEAKKILKSAYNIFSNPVREKIPDVNIVAATINLGLIYQREGKYDRALSYSKRAAELAEQLESPTREEELAYINNNIGFTLERQKKFEESLVYYRKSLNLKRGFWGEENLTTAITYNNLGRALGNLNHYDIAGHYFKKALRIRKKLLGENHQAVAQSYNNVAVNLVEKEQYEQAKEYYRKALSIYKNIYGPENRFVGLTTNNLGAVYSAEGKYNLALVNLRNAYEIYQLTLHPHHIWIAKNIKKRAKINQKIQKPNKSYELYKQVLEIHKTAFPEKLSTITTININIGKLLLQMGQFTKAEAWFVDSYNKLKNDLGSKNELTQRMLKNLIGMYEDTDKLQKANKYKSFLLASSETN